MQTANRNWVISATLLVVPLIYFYPVLLGQVILAPGDGWSQNFPIRALAGQIIARGELPLWNPYIFGGTPLAASVYPGAFYPLNWLFAILPAKWAMNIVVLATYHIALIGTYLYARRLDITRAGALVAGIAFTFGGFMINHLSHTSRIAAAAWLPWVLLAIENLARFESWRKTWRWVALGALFIAMQFFAGEPQMMVFTALTAAPCAVFALWQCQGRRNRVRFVLAVVAMLVCGAMLSAIQLLPSLELLAQSERSDPGVAFFDTYSFPPWQLPGLIFPYFFGGATFPPYRVTYWGAEIAAIMAGYVGMSTWVLAMVAIFSARRNGRVWLWLGIAVIAIILAFGGHLPFGLNHMLYQVPGYKTFRGLYRHQFEFTFAMAMLAGFGLSHLNRLRLRRGAIVMSVLITITAILYKSFGDSLATVNPRPVDAAALTNPEFFVPVLCFLLSVAALWLSQISNFKSQISNLILVAILLAVLSIDVASYGHFFHWRIATFDVGKRLADPPAVQFIKSRERDLNSFRVMSYPVQAYDYTYHWPQDPNFELINQPNISVLRGLQSISGYDILRPARVGEMMGTAGSVAQGFVQDIGSFGMADRGFDLLNVKYLIAGYGGATGDKIGVTYDGVYFARTRFDKEFKPGVSLKTEAGGAMSDELAIVSILANSAHLPDGAPVLKIRLHAHDGRVIEREVQAGRDTSEWAYDRADVRAGIKHSRARIVESARADGFDSHVYLGRVKFDRAEIDRIEWVYAREDASLHLARASLHDETTGVSTPLANFYLPPERWRKLAKFDRVEVYENLRVMPRAWFVSKPAAHSDNEELRLIRQGGSVDQQIENSQPKITRYESNRIDLETSNPEEGFLVLSEIYYPGWEARIDGQRAEVYRTNYVLRGVKVPPGDHHIEFVYRPKSLRNGGVMAGIGVAILMIGSIIVRPRKPAQTTTSTKAG